MARNKYPEETVQLILDTATRLFMQKGYERTSIQDIIDQLGGLSKGAIYHHFKSKEEILVAVTNRLAAQSEQALLAIRHRADLTGKQKLQKLLQASLDRPVHDDIFSVAPNIHASPALVSSILLESVETVAPGYVLPLIRQGMEDGSIQTDCPEELAELLMLVGNVWLDPMIFDDTPEKIRKKCLLYDKMLRGLGLDIMDDSMVQRLCDLTRLYRQNK